MTPVCWYVMPTLAAWFRLKENPAGLPGIAVAVTATPDRASVGVMAFCAAETMVIEEPPVMVTAPVPAGLPGALRGASGPPTTLTGPLGATVTCCTPVASSTRMLPGSGTFTGLRPP